MARAISVRLGAGSGYPLAVAIDELRGLQDITSREAARALQLLELRGMIDGSTQTGSRILQLLENRGLIDSAAQALQAGAISHGKALSTANTGYGAYFDPGLGRLVTLSDLTTISGTHYISDYTSGGTGGTSTTPKVVSKIRFTGDVIFDVPYVTLRACLLDNPTGAYLNGVHSPGAFLDYVTVSPNSVGDQCMQYESWSANRCYFRGNSDGAKINGGSLPINVTECYIRVKMQSGEDHNDGLQNVGGIGTVNIVRSNISVAPEGGLIAGVGGPNAAIMSADMTSGTTFRLNAIDNLLDGGTSHETVRFYDGGLTPNITYSATGNRFVRSSAIPLGRGTSNTTPTGQITWSNNVWDDDGSTIALS